MPIIRKPAAAGRFYPRFKREINNQIEECFKNKEFGPGKDLVIPKKPPQFQRSVLGGISPHAGYVYSGSGTAHTLINLFAEGMPDTVFILGTQHTGYYKAGLMVHGEWETPLGKVSIDSQLAQDILDNSDLIIEDDSAFNGYPHGREHNIEVQIPFLQYAAVLAEIDLKIVPIKIGVMETAQLEKIAKSISSAMQKNPERDIAIIASSDMTHYQPQNQNNPENEIQNVQIQRDKAIISAFEEKKWKEVYNLATKTSVCGPQTITTLMLIAKELNYTQNECLRYYTSYEKGGNKGPCDYSVGYFSGIIKK